MHDRFGARALVCIGTADLGGQIGNVPVSFAQDFESARLGAHGLLQELGCRKVSSLDELVEIVRQVDLHARHTPIYTPYWAPGTSARGGLRLPKLAAQSPDSKDITSIAVDNGDAVSPAIEPPANQAVMMKFRLVDDGGDSLLEAESFDDAIEQVKQGLESDETATETSWYHGVLFVVSDETDDAEQDDDADDSERGNEADESEQDEDEADDSRGDPVPITVVVHPTEPQCTGKGEHDWCSPRDDGQDDVRGHGGGVIIREICSECGCSKVTDTWARDPYDGTEGHRAIRYEEDCGGTDDERAPRAGCR